MYEKSDVFRASFNCNLEYPFGQKLQLPDPSQICVNSVGRLKVETVVGAGFWVRGKGVLVDGRTKDTGEIIWR
ncbi:hypothetical protein CFP56_041809 [Quercus suber]|uniref:Uncharacterized protein n=1 Tax=Quercus suber TaxID=58331 RepID=A0AAW0IUX3_QUESU